MHVKKALELYTKHSNKINLYLSIFILLILTLSLRITNLSYSEFQDDEKNTRIELKEGQPLYDFFLHQRKGPMQFIIAYIPHTYFKNNLQPNEFATRIPFTLLNILSVFTLFYLIKKITNSTLAAFLTSSLYSVNGFVVGFSRIAQYQNLNLVFSLLALYFFSNLTFDIKDANLKKLSNKKTLLNTFLGSLFTVLSILSHWDAVFYIVPLLYFYILFILNKNYNLQSKIKSILVIFIVSITTLIPYLIFYTFNLATNNSDNVEYLFKRIGTDGSLLSRHYEIFSLYNPLITLPLIIFATVISLLFIKKTYLYLIWFLFNFLVIKFVMVTPKTHIYNYVVPAVILSGISLYYLYDYVLNFTKFKIFTYLAKILLVVYLVLISLLYVQSYQMFVDHSSEYPFDDKKILWYEHKELYDTEVITFGFPHFRNWKEINEYIDPNCFYETNEDKGISQIYIRAKYGKNRDCYYIVVIKRPFVTQYKDVKYPGLKDSKVIYEYKNNSGTVSRVYKMK